MTKKLPHLTSIRAFEAAARHVSFTRAATELGLTQAAVSQQVKALEDATGQQLFVRRAREIALTPAGQLLAEQVSEAFNLLRTAFEDFGRQDEGTLAVAVLPSLAATWLTPRLKGFQARYPLVALKVQATQAMPLDVHGYDVGLWTGTGNWPGMRSHPLFPISFTPMCSPALLESHGPLNTLEKILAAPLIARYDRWWKLWFEAAGLPDAVIPDGPDISLGAQNLEYLSAIQGEGVALLTPYLFHDQIRTGQLIPLSDVVAEDGRSYWLVYQEARRRSTKIVNFRNWIAAEANATREAVDGQLAARSGATGGISRDVR